MTEKSKYEQLAAIDVSAHIEKKQNLSYLSWAWAVDQLLRADPAANWSYSEPMRFPDDTVMVLCTVTAFGKSMTMQLPVMDFRNKAVKNPDAFAINTAMMRCLVKAIALHGLGLYIYAGEDLPLSDDEPKINKETGEICGVKHKPTDTGFIPDEEETIYLMSIVDAVLLVKDDFSQASDKLAAENLDTDEKIWVWSKLDSKTRAGIKKYNNELKAKEQ